MAATPYQFGAKGDGLTDDTDALGRWALAGGGEIPTGAFRFSGPLRYRSGFTISKWEGKLLYCRGWPSGYAMCSADWGSRTRDVRINASDGGEIIFFGDSDMSRKGLGITYTEDFTVVNQTTVGGAAPRGINLFSAEVRYSSRGRIERGLLSVNSGQQGADGIHFIGDCSDIDLVGVHTRSGDDSIGLTVEVPKQAGARMQRITFQNCVLENDGHSSLKLLLASFAANSTIIDLKLVDCTMTTVLQIGGAGVPIIGANHCRATNGSIQSIQVIGGSTTVKVPPSGAPGGTVVQLQSVDNFSLVNHDIFHWHRCVLDALDCYGLIVEGGRVEAVAPLPHISSTPMYRLRSCPGARIDLTGKKAGWPSQSLIQKGGDALSYIDDATFSGLTADRPPIRSANFLDLLR